jgi:glycosyltransferase involved in cell wall biosynthesis
MKSHKLSQTLVIIPCFNEASRIPLDQFKRAALEGLTICFANDGSTDNTRSLLDQEFKQYPNVFIFDAVRNHGKAEIIRSAALKLFERDYFKKNGITWFGFWDADLATPLAEVGHFLDYQASLAPQTEALFGSRVLRLGANIKRSAKRHYLGRLFATVAHLLVGIKSYDSQCGAKLFKVEILEKVFREPFLSKWIFDVEILLRIGEEHIVEVPVRQWIDVPGSKVKVFKESLRVFTDLLAIRRKYGRR